MSQDRGLMIQETMRELAFRNHLRRLAEQRERRQAGRKKKEACTDGAAQTSRQMPLKNLLTNYTTEKEECQDVKSNRPEHTVYGEIRQQERCSDLPVYLL